MTHHAVYSDSQEVQGHLNEVCSSDPVGVETRQSLVSQLHASPTQSDSQPLHNKHLNHYSTQRNAQLQTDTLGDMMSVSLCWFSFRYCLTLSCRKALEEARFSYNKPIIQSPPATHCYNLKVRQP